MTNKDSTPPSESFNDMSSEGQGLLVDLSIAVAVQSGELGIAEEIRSAANSLEPAEAIRVAAVGLERIRGNGQGSLS